MIVLESPEKTLGQEQPPVIELSAELYPENTLGRELFPAILDGRKRSIDFDKVPLSINPSRKTAQVLADCEIVTAADLLELTPDQVDEEFPSTYRRYILEQAGIEAKGLVRRLAVLPQGRLLSAISGEAQGPVDANDEDAFIGAIDMIISDSDLRDRDREVLSIRYGIVDGQRHTLEEVGSYLGVSRERVRQVEARAFSVLRHPKSVEPTSKARLFSAFPLETIAREGGITYRRNVSPRLISSLASMSLPEATRQAISLDRLPRSPSSPRDLRAFGDMILSTPVSAIAHKNSEVVDDINKIVVPAVDRFNRLHAEQVVFGDLADEVAVPYGTTGVIRNMPTTELGLSDRSRTDLILSGFLTLGSLLQIGRDERGRVQPISPGTAHEIGDVASKLGFYAQAIESQI